jgi:hypothetical protein
VKPNIKINTIFNNITNKRKIIDDCSAPKSHYFEAYDSAKRSMKHIFSANFLLDPESCLWIDLPVEMLASSHPPPPSRPHITDPIQIKK